jgi:hypothetical protein
MSYGGWIRRALCSVNVIVHNPAAVAASCFETGEHRLCVAMTCLHV